jgi:thymidine kinase
MLSFRYGVMGSSKTMTLLMAAHNYDEQGKHVTLMKPSVDSRFGLNTITSRTGFERRVDVILQPDDDVDINLSGTDCVMVDEAQFLTHDQVDQLRCIANCIPVVCFGLRTDYQCRLFEGSQRLMEVADTIEEIRMECYFCRNKAIVNMKFIQGVLITRGDRTPDLGGNEKYTPGCWDCWQKQKHDDLVCYTVASMV